MIKKALIMDLDNTIYPVSSIGDELFAPLLKLIRKSGEYSGDMDSIRSNVMRVPFQKVAKKYSFSDKLATQGTDMLKELTYDKQITIFDDYAETREISCKKFLVTTGFTKMQESKVKQLGIKQDFDKIYIVDPTRSNNTKRDIFSDILQHYNYDPSDVLVVGDDPDAEIKAAEELGIDAILYDKDDSRSEHRRSTKISNFKHLHALV